MTALHRIDGRALPLPIDHLDTDQIMPKQFLRGIDKAGLGEGVFHDLRFDADGRRRAGSVFNDLRRAGASILLGGENFGCGSSREHAVWGMLQYGFRAVVAPGFAEIFHANAIGNRLVPVVLPGAAIDRLVRIVTRDPDCLLSIDLQAQVVSDPSGGSVGFPLAPLHRRMLIEGLDRIDLTLERRAAIEAFEREHRARHPWVWVGSQSRGSSSSSPIRSTVTSATPG